MTNIIWEKSDFSGIRAEKGSKSVAIRHEEMLGQFDVFMIDTSNGEMENVKTPTIQAAKKIGGKFLVAE